MQTLLNNRTPFVPLQFESIDKKLQRFGVVVAKGTFDIVNGQRLRISSEQAAPILEDQYFDSDTNSSLRFDSSLSPYKPATDVLVEATAWSPSERPEAEWISTIEVGDLMKSIRITGPRKWVRTRLGRRLTEVEPVEKVDVRYEKAFGGVSPIEPLDRCTENPVGTGYAAGQFSDDVSCPQLLPPDMSVPVFGRYIPPMGIGPVAPAWNPRAIHGGTYDESWIQTRSPYLPLDFSYRYYNVASEGLTFSGFAKGDEIFRLINLSVERQLTFGLPGINLISLLKLDDGRILPGPVNLDTVELMVEAKRAYLQWRGIFPVCLNVREVELHLSAPDDIIEN
jgi:hypothetical protein